MKITRSQSLALLILAGLIVSVTVLVAYPVWTFRHNVLADLGQKRQELAVYQQLVLQEEQFKQQLELLQQKNPVDAYYLKGGTVALAAAEMQRQLKQLTTRNKSELISTQIVDDTSDISDSRRASLRVHLRTNMSTLLPVLHSLESGKPMYILNNLQIDSRPARARNGAKIEQTTELEIRFDMLGFMAGGSG